MSAKGLRKAAPTNGSLEVRGVRGWCLASGFANAHPPVCGPRYRVLVGLLRNAVFKLRFVMAFIFRSKALISFEDGFSQKPARGTVWKHRNSAPQLACRLRGTILAAKLSSLILCVKGCHARLSIHVEDATIY